MTYQTWLTQLRQALNRAGIGFALTEADYPTVDIKRLYQTGILPSQAADITKSVYILTKDEYKKKPLTSQPDQSMM